MRFLTCTVFLLVLFAPAIASAANRTVCFELQFRDDRYDCAESSDFGERRACTNLYTYLVGGRIEVWDKDSGGGSGDEYIGTWVTTGTGEQCVTFPWEGETYHKGEAHPDVYLRYPNQVRSTWGNGPIVKAVQDNGSDYSTFSWRVSDSDNTYTANNCASGSSCRIYPSGAMLPTSSASSNASLAVQSLDSAQHTLQVYGGAMDSNTIKMELPDSALTCSSGCAKDRYNFGIPSSRGKDGDLTPHEMGHLIQMQEFGKQTAQDVLRNDCTKGTSNWNPTSDEFDSCATTEGFASYLAMVSLWDPDVSNANPFFSGFNVEESTPVDDDEDDDCDLNRGIPGQVIRAFWDLDDAANESSVAPGSGNDDKNYITLWLSNRWDVFPNGTGDGQDYESGKHGVNVRDYKDIAGTDNSTTLTHNCLQDQEDG